MSYKVTTTAPDVRDNNILSETARRVFEELLQYKRKSADIGGAGNDGNLRAAKR